MVFKDKYPWIGDFDHYIPDGWAKAFGDDLCREIQEEYDKMPEDAKEDFCVLDVKEKFGSLRIYVAGHWTYCEKIREIIRKYELISSETCIMCGKKATRYTTGWIVPLCDECAAECKFETEEIVDD